MFLDHTQRRTRVATVGRTPLDEWSARRRDLYLTTQDTHNRQTPMPPVEFEPLISASERSQTHALDDAATGIGHLSCASKIHFSACTSIPWLLSLAWNAFECKCYKVHCFLHATYTSWISVENLAENTTVPVVTLQLLLTRAVLREGNSAFRLKCAHSCSDFLAYTSLTLRNALKLRLHWICTIWRLHVT